MKRCGACGDECRKTKRARVLLPTGELVQRQVCVTCAKIGVRIVPVTISNVRKVCSYPDCHRWAAFCDEHRIRAVDWSAILRSLQARRRQQQLSVASSEPELGQDGDAYRYATAVLEGLDIAIGIVDAQAEGRPR